MLGTTFHLHKSKTNFGPDGYYYDKEGKRTDLGTNRYYQLHTHWYYIGKDGKILKGPQTIDGMNVYLTLMANKLKDTLQLITVFMTKIMVGSSPIVL